MPNAPVMGAFVLNNKISNLTEKFNTWQERTQQ